MTITRANLESILVQRCGGFMSFVGFAVTVAGSNANLNDPLAYALRQTGYSVTNITSVADADIAAVDDADLDQVIDYAEYRTMKNVAGNMQAWDITNGPESENFSQMAKQIESRIAKLKSDIDELYGAGVTAETGMLTYDFAEHNDSEIVDA